MASLKTKQIRHCLHEAAFPIVWAIKNNMLALVMICGDRSVIKGGKALEAQGLGGDSGGSVYRTGGENGSSLLMLLQYSSSFFQGNGSNLSLSSASKGQWKSL